MTCQQFRKLIDSYVSDELLIETNHDVLTHLENCVDCRNELAACREQRTRLTVAVRKSSDLLIDPAFAVSLIEDLRQTALKPSLWEQIWPFKAPFVAAAVASLLLVFAIGVLFVFKNRSDGNYPLTASVVNEMVNLAVGDHENCAIHFTLNEKPIPLAAAAEKYGRFYDGIDKTVMGALNNDDYEFIEAHSCVFEGQRFAHIVLKHGDKVVSVLVTKTDGSDNVSPSARGQFDGYHTASSFGSHYAFFVISDLSEQENLTLANNLAPAIASHMVSV
jgi:anti-sigma factor RsiW